VRRAQGYRTVIVNGAVVLRDNVYTDARNGQVV
jgi:hypothetical protein